MLHYPAPTYVTVNEATSALPPDSVVDAQTLSRLARTISGVIQHATRHTTYATGEDNLPTSEVLRGIFRDATLAQLQAVVEAGLVSEVLNGGATTQARLSSTGSNGKSVSLDHSAADMGKAHLISGGLAPEAHQILASVGLLSGLPGVIR